ncbi:MAG TPA: transcriptional repressor [Sedimentisphaerales bacterium]|jgi:Fur family peroxide stress response transcriptional regulator|nr:transcriptional repressor [Sedimentisphaerales bacterium]HNU31883.1 transcriptional repressor [Sedimentisphaerales bacterium]
MTLSKAEIDRRVQAFVQTCRQRGMKVTHQRVEIFQELAGSAEHPDAETIFQKVSRHMPSISRDTVYRTLSTLEDEGLVRKVEPLFESARYDANLDRHHHFICTVCGLVSDFYSQALDDLLILRSVEALGEIACARFRSKGPVRPV